MGQREPAAATEATGHIAFTITGHVVELIWTGFIADAGIASVPEQLEKELVGKEVRYAIFDARPVTDYAADSRLSGGAILGVLKAAGVKRTWVITESGSIRMIGSAVALAVGLSMRFVATREEAISGIDELDEVERKKRARRQPD